MDHLNIYIFQVNWNTSRLADTEEVSPTAKVERLMLDELVTLESKVKRNSIREIAQELARQVREANVFAMAIYSK